MSEQLLAPAQAKRRRIVRKTFSKWRGLTTQQIAAAEAYRKALAADPFMKCVKWDAMLGSGEWKMRCAYSVTTGKISTVEFVVGKAIA